VDFETFEQDGLIYYRFDTIETECPEPMVNAMHGLKLLDSMNKRLVMINMQEPMGLYPRIANDFEWEVEPLDGGDVRITFKRKAIENTSTDFENTYCSG
jgi:hypothetical protein